jgi:succinoglycan biosynthesis transport protein ExoP
MSAQASLPPEQLLMPVEMETEFHISQWLDVLRRRRALLAVVTVVVMAFSLVRYAMSPKLYRATTILQIERRAGSAVAMQQPAQYDDWMEAQYFYPTQYRLLQSRGLAERVVKNLRLGDEPVFNPARGHLVGTSSTSAATAADDNAALAGLAFGVLGGLEVAPVRSTSLVEVSYVSTNPELAARVANGVADAYIDWGVETRFATVGRASSFLSSQIEGLKQEIQDKEAQLQAYSRRTDVVALDPSSNTTLQRLEALNKDYVGAVSERIGKEAHYKELMNSPDDIVADTVSGGLVTQLGADQLKLEREYATKLNTYKPEWPAMQELKAQIDRGRQHMASTTQEMVAKARESTKAEYQGALRREEALAAELSRQKGEALRLNSASVEYNNLKVEVSTRRSLLDELVRKQSETEVTSRLKGTKDSNVVVVDRALVPGAPYLPSLFRSLTLGLMLGLGLGLGAVFFLEYLDRTIKTSEDVDRILNLPVLGVIPDIYISQGRQGYGRRVQYSSYYYGRRQRGPTKPRKTRTDRGGDPDSADVQVELASHDQPRLAVSEAYRSLRTALLLSTAHHLKSIVITSAVPGEGKTTTATNLAVVLAQLGKEVLLVDADLRKPRLHEIFGKSNRVGLVNFLTGGADEAAVVLPTKINQLHLTPAGPMPPNPSELLSSEKMVDFTALAYQRFDYVVFDTPPALPVTDATVLGSMADGVVLCVGSGLVMREDARSCRQRLQLSEVRVLGVALNLFREQLGYRGRRYQRYQQYIKEVTAGTGEKA